VASGQGWNKILLNSSYFFGHQKSVFTSLCYCGFDQPRVAAEPIFTTDTL
jgi:hypothetical protein